MQPAISWGPPHPADSHTTVKTSNAPVAIEPIDTPTASQTYFLSTRAMVFSVADAGL